ncbi:hypothetical protein ACCC98_05330 [Rhizobium pisi]|uniref:hypothetical protein n=1 Tax=Rhizobium pisi TaxID=574561 RepID=UPI0039B0D59D
MSQRTRLVAGANSFTETEAKNGVEKTGIDDTLAPYGWVNRNATATAARRPDRNARLAVAVNMTGHLDHDRNLSNPRS